MNIKKFRDYYLYFMFYSVAGWIYEVTWFFQRRDKFINRGFLFGPYLPIYGFGALIIILLLSKLKTQKICIKNFNITPIIIFAMITLISTIIEYITHFVLDTYFDIRLWNYKNQFLNINGRICLKSSLLFGIAGIIALYFAQPFLSKYIKKLPEKVKNIIAIALGIIMITDLIIRIAK